MPPRRIAVLLHERDHTFASVGFLLLPLIERWRAMGVQVEVLRGPRHLPPADLVIPHLDLTVMPPAYREILNRYPAAFNRRISDISKSAISANLLRRGDPYLGEVIVKTNRNYGGLPENRLQPPPRPSLSRRLLARGLRCLGFNRPARLPWELVSSMHSDAYPVFPSLRDVPRGVFRNSQLVVERFLPERDGEQYCLRYSYVLGNRQVSYLLRSNAKVVKGSNASGIDEVAAPPDFEAIRQRLGIDYGKLDYVVRDGRTVLFDVNWTPSFSTLDRHGLTSTVVNRLADGIAAIAPAAHSVNSTPS